MDEDGKCGDYTPAESAGELRRKWGAASQTVKYLERRGGPLVPSEVLDAAKRHRDDTERAWRAVREPHPIGKRLRWAAAALDEALAKEDLHRSELREFEAEVERRRGDLLARQAVDVARTTRKRTELDAFREEAGPAAAGDDVARKAMDAMRGVRPTL